MDQYFKAITDLFYICKSLQYVYLIILVSHLASKLSVIFLKFHTLSYINLVTTLLDFS